MEANFRIGKLPCNAAFDRTIARCSGEGRSDHVARLLVDIDIAFWVSKYHVLVIPPQKNVANDGRGLYP